MGTKSIKLAIATDLHYLSSELRDDGEAFELMTRFSDGAMTSYGDEIFDAFLSEMTDLRPDAVLITGDLTFNGEKKSHEHLSEGFAGLYKAGIPILLFPGNHDLENPMAGAYLGSEAMMAENVSKGEFAGIYTFPEADPDRFLSRDTSSFSFSYALEDDLWLVCSDVNGNGLPGVLTEGVLSWDKRVLEEASRKNVRVIGATHQNLLPHNALISAGFVMEGASRLLDLYREYGVHLNLSGHMHIQHVKRVQGLTEIVTSALMIPPCQYGILDIEGDMAVYHSKVIDVAGWAVKKKKTDEDLLNFPDFASSSYLNVQRRAVMAELEDTGLTSEEIQDMASSLGRFNQAFFAGTLKDLDERESTRRIWHEKLPGNFRNDYMDSIFEEGITDEQNVVVSLRQEKR